MSVVKMYEGLEMKLIRFLVSKKNTDREGMRKR